MISNPLRPTQLVLKFLCLAGLLFSNHFTFEIRAQSLGDRSGSQFAHVITNPRVLALGEVSTALRNEFSGYGNNPAALGYYVKSSTEFSMQRVSPGVSLEHLGATLVVSPGLSVSANFEILHFGGTKFFVDSGVKNRGFESRLGVSIGKVIGEGFSLGTTVQAFHATTDVAPQWAYAVELGAVYVPSRFLTYGLSVRGIGTDYKVLNQIVEEDSYESRIPRVIAAGVTLDFPFDAYRQNILMTIEHETILGAENLITKVGLEYGREIGHTVRISGRGGFLFRGRASEPRAGIGVEFSGFVFDYGYRFVKRDGVPSHLAILKIPI